MPVSQCILPIMLALCLMLLVNYYAFNYASIIGWGLPVRIYVAVTIINYYAKFEFGIIQWLRIFGQKIMMLWPYRGTIPDLNLQLLNHCNFPQ